MPQRHIVAQVSPGNDHHIRLGKNVRQVCGSLQRFDFGEQLQAAGTVLLQNLPQTAKLFSAVDKGLQQSGDAEFRGAADITGLVLTKLDGTAKGGVVLTIKKQLGIPVKYIGVGEGIDDMKTFDPEEFAEALFQ